MPKARNKSETEQAFTGFVPFAAGETREVSEVEAMVLARSPHMEIIEDQRPSSRSTRGTSKDRSFKGVDAE